MVFFKTRCIPSLLPGLAKNKYLVYFTYQIKCKHAKSHSFLCFFDSFVWQFAVENTRKKKIKNVSVTS